jgi:uncharacterized protein (DUF488 family)
MNLISNLLKPDLVSSSGQKIYLTGYRGREVTDLPKLLSSLDAVLIDIRFTPSDSSLRWGREYLKLLLKNKYLHVPHLGSRTSGHEGKFSIQNLDLGIRIITELKANVLLMCECADEEKCHRTVIGKKLKEQGIEAEEIKNWSVKPA